MLTTTPFLRPREGCEPRPSSSIELSSPTSPTSATTLEVPMSSPTMRLRSARLSIVTARLPRARGSAAAPADSKPVRVPHIHVGNVLAALRDQLERRAHEFLEALIDLTPPQAHGDAVGEVDLPGAACIEPQGGEAQAGLKEPPFDGEVALRDRRLLPLRATELRQLRRDVALVGVEELATGVDEAVLAPARRGALLDHQHVELAWPGALHAHRIHPRQRVNGAAHRCEIHRQEACAVHLRLDHALDVNRRDPLKAAGHRYRLDRLIERPDEDQRAACGNGRHPERNAERAPVDAGGTPACFSRLAAVFRSTQHALPNLMAARAPAAPAPLSSSSRARAR